MKTKVTTVFDIGRTNKKFFLFKEDFQEVYREYTRFDEIIDEDSYPTEKLQVLEVWAKEVFDRMLDFPEYDIEALNFSPMASGAQFTLMGRSFLYGCGTLGNKWGNHTISMLKTQFKQVMDQLCSERVKDLPKHLITN